MLGFYCEQCGRNTDLMTINEASAAVGVSRRTIYSWIEKGRLHLMQNAGGRTLICKTSLLQKWDPPDHKRAAERGNEE